MEKFSTYKLRNGYSSIKLVGFIILMSFFLVRPIIQTILHFSNEDFELCENSEEENTEEEVELDDDFIEDFNAVNKLKIDYLGKHVNESTSTYHTKEHLSNFIIEVTSPPPELV